MAVIRRADYYAGHLRRARWVGVAAIVIVDGALAGLLAAAGVGWLQIGLFIVPAMTVLMLTALAIVGHFALEPLALLSRAVAHVAHETNDVTPPLLAEQRYERTGLKAMVQTIYDLAAAGPTSVGTGQATSPSLATQVFEHLPGSLIALDERGSIVLASAAAPIHIDDKGQQSIELLWPEGDTLEAWLASCAETKVADSHTWSRIPTGVPGSDNRRLFDIAAHYQKGSSPEAVILLMDRTAHYSPDEEDMDFIALAAHELRGPITVIRGYLDVLEGELHDVLQPGQTQLIERLNVSAARLSGYVSNILNVSRYDRRHLKLHLHEDRLSDVYASIADDLQLRASTQNRLLSVTLPADLPTIAADRNSLSEVLANLVDNAIKYSNEGGQVSVTAAVDGDYVTCSVEDHGIGIPAGLVGNLFTKFYRSHHSRQSVTGTGLGLYIARGIIESHGGKIGLRTAEGKGSTFTFSVPIYSTVKDKLAGGNVGIIESSSGWIRNHAMYRG